MVTPVPGVGQGTPYGARGSYWSCDEDGYGNGIHTGCDYPAGSGTKVVAARPGTAYHCNHGSAFGSHQVEVRCGDGTRDFYAHMRQRIGNGVKVKAGDKVGEVGAEGNVTGPHLHFERHATETGGWSCGVVRDPKPSINYAEEPPPPPPAGDDDVPEFVNVGRDADMTFDGNWQPIYWDKVSSDSTGKVATAGNAGLVFTGRYVATIFADVTVDKGVSVWTRTVEGDFNGPGGDWQALESNNPVEHVGTDGNTTIGDTRVQTMVKDRKLRVQIKGPKGKVVNSVACAIVYWP